MEKQFNELTVGEIVAGDFRKAEIFDKHNIDFCCGGKKSFGDACHEVGVEPDLLKTELENVDKNTLSPSENYANWDLPFLTDFIINTHHKYITNSVPVLLEKTKKIANVHGEHHPELVEVKNIFETVAKDLMEHLAKEEQILFPLIKSALGEPKNLEALDSIGELMQGMEREHDYVGEQFHIINKLTGNYSVPTDGCATYQFAFGKLKEFENDLHKHVHLENNILFAKLKTIK